jgi:hypothetical protein
MIMDSDFQLTNDLLNNLNLLNQVYSTKRIKDHLISKFSINKNEIVLSNSLKSILGISKEIKSININTVLMIIKINHTIPIIKPSCMFLEYNQEPEFVNSLVI